MSVIYTSYSNGYLGVKKWKACLALSGSARLGSTSQARAALFRSFLYDFVVNVYG